MDGIWYAEITDENDFYIILGCDECSTTDQINAEYKVLVRELHPDKRPNDPDAAEKFNKIQKARDVLANKKTRADYDNWRRSGLNIPYDMWVATRGATHVDSAARLVSHVRGHVHMKPIPHLLHWLDNLTLSLHWAIGKQPQQALEDSDSTPADIEWKRDTGDEIMNKFRNYQI